MADSLSKALDRAIAAENKRALADIASGALVAAPTEPKYPAGTPEYEAYAARLRAALADPHAFDFLEI